VNRKKIASEDDAHGLHEKFLLRISCPSKWFVFIFSIGVGSSVLHDPFSVCRFSFLVQQHPYDDELFPLGFSFAD